MRTQNSNIKSFTLIEMLMALAISVIVIIILFNAYSLTATSYQRSEARTDTFRDGRAALRLMNQDIESLVSAQSVMSTTNTPAFPKIEVVTGTNGAMGFLSCVPQSMQPSASAQSDVCLVEYFVAQSPNGARNSKSLYRTLIPSDQTYTRLVAGGSTLLKPADQTANATNAEPVADNVLNFSVKVLDPTFAELQAGATNQAYVQMTLEVIGSRSAPAYFAVDAPEALKHRIENDQSQTFTLRCRLNGKAQ